ncbi:MAG TPA: class I SAM-dependent methyltransferase [Telluria sp.]|nr:class I SAM-dependent methyltransferase [Telluria sp.]
MTFTATNTGASTSAKLKLLHVGCGSSPRERLPFVFQHPNWQEVRYDIDPAVCPHLVGSITDMSSVPDASMDAIWSSHNLEHLNSFEVPTALAEFRRVLKPTGFVLISLPDMLSIAKLVVDDALGETLYESPAGPIRPLDMIFGHQAAIKAGNNFMAHRTGFTATTLGNALADAGFDEVRVHEGTRWDLWAVATMPDTDASVFYDLADVMQ